MKKSLKLIGGIVVAVLLLTSAVYFGIRKLANNVYASVASQLPQAQKDAQSVGLPLSMEELFAERPISPEENAAPFYKEAISCMQKLGEVKKKELQKTESALSAGSKQEWEAGIANRQVFAGTEAYFAAWKKAASKPKLRFDRNWKEGLNILFPEYSEIKSAVKLHCFRALQEAKAGQLDAALEYLRTAYAISRQLKDEPVLIGYLVHVACLAISDRGAVNILPEVLKAGKVGELKAIVQNGHIPVDPMYALRGDFVLEIESIHWFDKQKGSWNEVFNIFGGESGNTTENVLRPKVSPLADKNTVSLAFETRYLQLFTEAKKIAKNDTFRFSEELDKLTAAASTKNDPTYLCAQFFMPVFVQSGDSINTSQVSKDLTLALIEVARFKAKHGRLPGSLSEAGVFAMDPYANGPLSYRIEDGQAIIYSYGRNKVDDGGVLGNSADTAVSYPPYFRFSLKPTTAGSPAYPAPGSGAPPPLVRKKP